MSAPAPTVDERAAWWHDATSDLGLQVVLDVTRVAHERTANHEVEVFAHERLGWALALDGRLLHVEEDPSLREMLVHVPLLGREPGPERVLVVGGGDGIVLREVLAHESVTRAVVLEPEPALVRAGERLGTGTALADPRVTFHASLETVPDTFDVVLLERPLHGVGALVPLVAEGGVLVEWDLPIPALDGPRWHRRGGQVERLGAEERYLVSSPILPGGFACVSLHTAGPATHAEPRGTVAARHYTPDLHRAAFALPPFWSGLP